MKCGAVWCLRQFRRLGIVNLRPTRLLNLFTRIGDLSRQWRIGRETVRLLVEDKPGVAKIRIGRRNLAKHRLPNTSEGWTNLHFFSGNLKGDGALLFGIVTSTDPKADPRESRRLRQALASSGSLLGFSAMPRFARTDRS